MRRLSQPGSILILLVGLLLGATGSNTALAAGTQGRAPDTRETAKYDAWLQKEIRHRMLMLPRFTVFDNLQYSIDGYTVTLSGQVLNGALKDDAGSAVKEIEGVQKVVNNIEILPPSPMDFRIRRSEFRAIYSWGPFEKYALQAVPPIHIIVKNGHVTLEGVVDNQADKDAANVRANEVPGVFSVTNNLKVG